MKADLSSKRRRASPADALDPRSLLEAQAWLGRRRVDLVGLPAGSVLHRVCRPDASPLAPAPAAWRDGRLDPPAGRKERYGVLYTGGSRLGVCVEARRLVHSRLSDGLEVSQPLAPGRLCTLVTRAPLLLVHLDTLYNTLLFRCPESQRGNYALWQQVSWRVWSAVQRHPLAFAPVAGIAYRSFHRHSPCLNAAIFDDWVDRLDVVGRPRAITARLMQEVLAEDDGRAPPHPDGATEGRVAAHS
ncbi:RES domain-containing protein [Aquabacterium sp. A7-Y]|uniref:RES domain-containing protein n=1 Tax=Aquabacterium sp. A7-Y TaxID=1349605 RepID=UPI00223D338E|nr:RES domain-containing protein [Aquabacterium sp. A7-Y]MCW7541557.1 RES domain-containing protein [Aquabacterium sp. A7-Y]